MSFVIPPGEARFTTKHPKWGVRVRVASTEDLTDQKVEVKLRAGGTRTVRLTKRLAPASGDKPALYRFEQWTAGQRKEHQNGSA